jgi:hypothetical protein
MFFSETFSLMTISAYQHKLLEQRPFGQCNGLFFTPYMLKNHTTSSKQATSLKAEFSCSLTGRHETAEYLGKFC